MAGKSFVMAEVKSVDTDSSPSSGAFEVVLSAATLDRDGEVVDAGAFEPLPDSIPFHAFHDFGDPVGRAVPFYDGGVLKARGVFASTPRAQEIRTLVAEGVIGHTSVGFMAADRVDGKDAPHVVRAELLEGSFVSVPANREAAVLMVKEYAAKAGSRNSAKDSERLQSIHDLAVANGAVCVVEADSVGADSTDAPGSPAVEAGKTLASEVVDGVARVRVDAALACIM